MWKDRYIGRSALVYEIPIYHGKNPVTLYTAPRTDPDVNKDVHGEVQDHKSVPNHFPS